jgi:hypothetical protein
MSIRDLHVEVQGGYIIVTLPGSHYSVTYYRPGNASHLIAKNIADRDDPRLQLTVANFLESASRAADHKARDFGWIA